MGEILRNRFKKISNKRGVSVAELLIVVAIVCILAMVTFIAVTHYQKTLRQKELDTKAQTVYTAVQNQLTRLRTAGNESYYTPDSYSSTSETSSNSGITKLISAPSDWAGETVLNDDGTYSWADNIYYITSSDKDDSSKASYYIVSNTTVDNLLKEHYWVVEYAPELGSAYSVFYWENNEKAMIEAGTTDGYDFESFDILREYNTRLNAGAYIGYYCGSTLTGSEATTGNKEITVHNEETLYAEFQYSLSNTTTSEVIFEITLSDQHGHSRVVTYSTKSLTNKLSNIGKKYMCSMTFDDLTSDETRFYNLFGAGSGLSYDGVEGNQALLTGDNIDIKLSVSIPSDGTFATQTFEGVTFNSLFADDSVMSDDKNSIEDAHIGYGRHLQNLDESANWEMDVTGATQVNDISFKENEDEDSWYAVYSQSYFNIYNGSVSFKPIVNNNLTSYNGLEVLSDQEADVYHSISGIPIKAATSAGLFEDIASGASLSNISIIAPDIDTGDIGSSGALFGELAEDVGIDNCRIYLSTADGDTEGKDETDIWIGGKYTGGLIGMVKEGSVSIGNSFASLVIGHTADEDATTYYAGGLIGYVDGGTISISKSYADSYIYGDIVAGLVGYSDYSGSGAASYINISSSYTAGFLYPGDTKKEGAAGIIYGAATVSDSYAYTYADEKNAIYYSTVYVDVYEDGENEDNHYRRDSNLSNVYYYNSGTQINGSDYVIITSSTGSERISGDENDGLYRNADDSSSFAKLSADEFLAALNSGGDYFVNDNVGKTYPYELKSSMALDTYPQPRLNVNLHYGDWNQDFVPGALVYYEKYVHDKSSVRFYGGNVNALYDNLDKGAVYGDGYGIVYRASDAKPDSATIVTGYGTTDTIIFTGDSSYKYSSSGEMHQAYTYTDGAGVTYEVYPLKTETVNYAWGGDNAKEFYHSANITYTKDSTTEEQLYYFNPHFARAVGFIQDKDESKIPKLTDDATIYIRSARHLYDLSLYYKNYRASTKGRTFRQTFEISYTDYNWEKFFNDAKSDYVITRQNPIGTADSSFVATYNGGCYKIENISFVLAKDYNGEQTIYYGGLFGRNEGTIKNVVLWAEYNEDDGTTSASTFKDSADTKHYYVPKDSPMQYFVGTDENIGANQTMYLGILVGRNSSSGRVDNCAVAGYYMANSEGTIRGYSNSYLYAGGLVGGNSGKITNCSADTPYIRVTTNYANAKVAGFVGTNVGNIVECYALGHIEIVSPRGGSIVVSGFAGKNTGQVSYCYSGADFVISGDMSKGYPFAPTGGIVYKSNYLSSGTYSYANHLYSYSLVGGSATALTYDELVNAASDTATSAHSYDYESISDVSSSDAYPFEAYVTNSNGKPVHYGDWQKKVNMGEFGLFYWEKEEDSDNSGYHLTYIGQNADGYMSGTTLCTAHDDVGIITEYGYGYYEASGSDDVTDISASGINLPSDGNIDTAAAAGLAEELDGYDFYPYTTLPLDVSSSQMNNYLYLTNSKDYGTITIEASVAGYSNTVSVEYNVAPFFANAMYRSDVSEGDLVVRNSDGTKTDYSKEVGNKNHKYVIRSVEQLQYINWNFNTKTTTELVTSTANIYQGFTYLSYASSTGTTKQTRAAAGNNDIRYFSQTHDLSGYDESTQEYKDFTPIAGAYTSSSANSYDAVLYTWFGGNFDGQSYKIQNVHINSESFTVGLFGVTVSAGINNIIMYSDMDTEIKRQTPSNKTGGYNIGGLVGVAYMYASDTASGNKISNCSVAGYKIVDASTNQQTLGEANVGGLIGATSVALEKCSAVADIEINCTHENGYAMYGDYIRVGGLVGALSGMNSGATDYGTITDCYTGGNITVGDETLAENRNFSKQTVTNDGQVVDGSGNIISVGDNYKYCYRRYSTNIFIAGIAGSGFTMNFINFSGGSGSRDTSPVINNSYTYVNFPAVTGSIRGITTIASLADRYASTGYDVVLNDCYYLGSSGNIDVSNAAKYKIAMENLSSYATESLYNILNSSDTITNTAGVRETMYENMVRGGSSYARRSHQSMNRINNDKAYPTSVNYSAMSGEAQVTDYDGTVHSDIQTALNSGASSNEWGWVTTTQGTANIDGKYSFPGNNPALDGLNYPFPTIITQKDLVFSTNTKDVYVNVHYGSWPLKGLYFASARDTIDIFADRQDPSDTYATKEIILKNVESDSLGESDFVFESANADIAQIVGITKQQQSNGNYDYTITIRALNVGTEKITVTDLSGDTATLTLEVTANLNVTTDPTDIAQGVDESTDLTLYAKAAYANALSGEITDYSKNVSWSLSVQDSDYAEVTTVSAGHNVSTVTSLESKRTQIIVSATATYGDGANRQTFTFDYYVSLLTYGDIGLTNYNMDNGDVFYNETKRSSDSAQNSNPHVGEDAVNKYTSRTTPTLELDGNADLYIYESYDDQSLQKMTIESLSFDDATFTKDNTNNNLKLVDDGSKTTYESSDYIVDIGSYAKVSADDNFSYRALKVRPKDGNGGGNVTVTIVLRDGETDATYRLRGTIRATHIISYDVNGADKQSIEITRASAGGNATLTDAIPTKSGYVFEGWSENKNASEATYCTGESNNDNTVMTSVTEDTVLYAIYSPIKYNVEYYVSGDDVTIGGETFSGWKQYGLAVLVSYENEAGVRAPTISDIESVYTIVDDSKTFTGWNTKKDGSGDFIAPSATLPNLTQTNGDTVELYAQFDDCYTLSFADNYDSSSTVKTATVDIADAADGFNITTAYLPTKTSAKTIGGVSGYYRTTSGITYRLLGWSTNSTAESADSGLSIATGSTTLPKIDEVTGSQTYYAIWQRMTYTVKLYRSSSNTSTLIATYVGAQGDETSLQQLSADYVTPTKSGYTFVGWYSDKKYESDQVADVYGSLNKYSSSSDSNTIASWDNDEDFVIELYAIWKGSQTRYKEVSTPVSGASYVLSYTSNNNNYILNYNNTTLTGTSSTISAYSDKSYDDNGEELSGTYYSVSTATLWSYNGNLFNSAGNYITLRRRNNTNSIVLNTSQTTTGYYRMQVNANGYIYASYSSGRTSATYYVSASGSTISASANNPCAFTFYEPITVYTYEY